MAASSTVSIVPLPALADIAPCEETGATFEENAIQKALYYGAHTREWLFAEDSGLEVDALHGDPGVYSARYAGPGATDEANNALLLERLGSSIKRTAHFVSVIALVHGGLLQETFRGTVDGEILMAPEGTGGFGYDPLFYYPPFDCSFGAIDRERKQMVSHRGSALKLLMAYLKHHNRPTRI